MESPLWIDAHAPALDDLPQADLRRYLSRVTGGPINLLLHGPPGSGKTAAARALARATHDDPDNDLIEINVADFFDRTKSEILDDPRFSPFLQGQTPYSKRFRDGTSKDNKYKKDWSKREMIAYVLKEMASYKPSAGEYKTILLDNAESMREDFQQALRRVMERHYEATQFVIATRQPTKLIPAIRSRCFPVPVPSPARADVVAVLRSIADAEDVPADEAGLEYIADHADGDLRQAILDAQAVAEAAGEITREAAYETIRDIGPDEEIEAMLDAAAAADHAEARSTLDHLLLDEGYTGAEVLDAVRRVSRARDGIADAELASLAGEIDLDLVTGTNDRLHLAHLLAELGARS